jgi:ABC-2 type transport system permease protein
MRERDGLMKVLDIALKDLVRSFRSLFAVGMMVVAPLLLTGLIYFAFGGMGGEQPDMPAIRVGLVNLDVPPADAPFNLGQSIVEMFADESVADWLVATHYPDGAAARAAVDQQEVGAAVLIPAGLSAAILSGERDPDAAIVIVQDPTLTIGPQVVRDMIASLLDGFTGGGIALQVIQERAARLPPGGDLREPGASGEEARLEPGVPRQVATLIEEYQTWYVDFQRALFHEPERAALRMVVPSASGGATAPMQQILSMVMVGQMIFFAFYTGAYSMMSILQEQEEGTLARLFTTPTDRTLVLGGKFVAVLLTVIGQGVALMVFGRFAFGVAWGRPASVALAVVGQVVAAAGLGVMLISLVKNTRQAGAVLGGGLTAFGMLGGLFTVGIQGMPALFDTLSVFTPQGWVLKAWRVAIAGGTPGELLVPFVVSVAIGGAMFAIGAVLFRRRFA